MLLYQGHFAEEFLDGYDGVSLFLTPLFNGSVTFIKEQNSILAIP
jgi:hypothetical protein